MTCGEFHGYLHDIVSKRFPDQNKTESNLQDTTPVHANDEDSKTSTVQDEADPVEMQEKLLGKLLTMQHTEGRWVCRDGSVN